jgi:hypothetical protein
MLRFDITRVLAGPNKVFLTGSSGFSSLCLSMEISSARDLAERLQAAATMAQHWEASGKGTCVRIIEDSKEQPSFVNIEQYKYRTKKENP